MGKPTEHIHLAAPFRKQRKHLVHLLRVGHVERHGRVAPALARLARTVRLLARPAHLRKLIGTARGEHNIGTGTRK